jgi:hypothetical protein
VKHKNFLHEKHFYMCAHNNLLTCYNYLCLEDPAKEQVQLCLKQTCVPARGETASVMKQAGAKRNMLV